MTLLYVLAGVLVGLVVLAVTIKSRARPDPANTEHYARGDYNPLIDNPVLRNIWWWS